MPGDEVGKGLHDSEADDERDNNCRRSDPEFLGADQRHDRPLEAHHAADEGIQEHEERELLPVLAQSEAHFLCGCAFWSSRHVQTLGRSATTSATNATPNVL